MSNIAPDSILPESAPTFAGVLDLARLQRLALTDVFQIASAFGTSGKQAEAAQLYKTWIAYNDSHPLLHLVYFNFAVTLRQQGDIPGSIHALRACLKIDPRFGQAHINLGRALEDSGLATQAIQQWRAYADMTADISADRTLHRLLTLQHIGRVMENAGLMEEAETVLWQAIELRPDKTEAGQHWSALRQRQCKWPILTPSEHASHRQLIDSMSPLSLACYSDDPLFQLAKAYRYNKSFVGRPDTTGFTAKKPVLKTGTTQKLRVGYVSSDLRDHAVGFALREVLELHDSQTVEIYAYYCGDPVVNDPTQERMKAAVAVWRDIFALSDADAARQIAKDDIDILIDVNGYTKHARTKIFAYRPAPVIVNFCGYPGSMGSPFHQYMITDGFVAPEGSEIYYSEKVLTIPCTQPVDRKRVIASKPTRGEAGLPEDAFVFACFNGMQKTTEATFGQWMEIMAAVPNAVLWLLTGGDTVDEHLRQLAEKAGIVRERLVFAPKAPNAKHLARIACADLFLDTFPYGAHSTAADALTVGLPVLTYPGKSFAARFCASIVSAAGIPELICENPGAYVEKAIAFASAPDTLQAIRQTLEARRDTSVLRDMPGLARRLEELFWQMQAKAERGETPVPDLANLDLYYEIGAELVDDNITFSDDETYRRQYHDRLAAYHDYAPIAPDRRLWPADPKA
ncbi:glycosyl transferase [Rhizobium sp. FY34]|uniref:O-linked N-acetylglucosamine transferase, SPINDLY family protein n=1 Tax=Rhizobium sp. FY34 TaxID=2562309 RepID=UPI0010C08266|nr:glycosyl transferase [Rhizobium sp. FY34]